MTREEVIEIVDSRIARITGLTPLDESELPETVQGYPAMFDILYRLGYAGFSHESIRNAGRAGRIAGVSSENRRGGTVRINVRQALESLRQTRML